MVLRSTDAEIRATRPGITADAIARWRHLAANPPETKGAADFWYRPAGPVADLEAAPS